MALNPGTHLGPYEIQALLAEDLTGDVYKAVDTRTERTVALKALPADTTPETGAQAGLKQRAHAVTQLRHPHICALYELGRERPVPPDANGPAPADTDAAADSQPKDIPPVDAAALLPEIDFLVLEHLEGQTLAARLEGGALPLREAVTIAIAIADALHAGHQRNIIHGQLRPSNVLLSGDGAVKVLNFGLATAQQVSAQAISPMARTMAVDVAAVAAAPPAIEYAAPEQLEGRDTDPRSDIFSLGAMLFEMVTGAKPFQGKNQTLLVAAIVSLELDPLSSLRPGTPRALDHVAERCLEKNPEERWQTAHDLGVQLRWISEGGAVLPSSSTLWDRALRIGLAAAIVLAVVASASAFVFFRADEPEPFQFRVPVYGISQADIAMSPDGESIAVVARPDPPAAGALYIRSTRTPAFRRIAGTDDAAQPFWSPDSRTVGFVAGGRLKQVAADGGAPQDVGPAPGFMGGAWGPDGTILYGTAKGLFRISAEGGSAQPVTTVARGEAGHYWPALRPGGRHFTYLAWSPKAAERAIFLGTLGSSERKKLLTADSNAAHVPGYMLYHRDAALFAHVFDDDRQELAGDPLRLADELLFNSANGRGSFDVSQNGSLLYYQGQGGPAGRAQVNAGVQFGWRDRSGAQLGPAGDPGTYGDMDLSPNGRFLAVTRQESGNTGSDIWILDWQRGAPERLTLDPADDINPVWSNDGLRVAFTTFRKGNADVYVKNANGVGPETPLLDSPAGEFIEDWSRDGRFIAYKLGKEGFEDIYALPMTGEDRKPIPMVEGPFRKDEAQFSHDGKYIAYASDESGSFQIYVMDFPARKDRELVSTIGGGQPRWDASGRRLYYRAPDNSIMEVDLTFGSGIEASPPRRLFFVPALVSAQDATRHMMSVTGDGERFLTRYPNTGGGGLGAALAAGGRGATGVSFNFTPAQGGQAAPLGRGAAFTNNPTLGLTVIRQWPSLLREGAP